MLTSSYRKRLEADLPGWVAAGLVTPEAANAIRLRAQEQAGGVRLPAILGMLGGLLLASSVAAFVAANWALMPRPAKVAMILAAIAAALFTAYRLSRNGPSLASDAAATCAALIFLAGVALVGQMYHLPADWAAGAITVWLGAFIVAVLMRSDGALVVAFAACLAWLLADFQESGVDFRASPVYLLLCAPAVIVALGRDSRIVHHAAVLAVGAWLALHASASFAESEWPGVLAYWLAIIVVFIALGWLSIEGGRPDLLAACLPWGLAGYVIVIMMQLLRILERSSSAPGHASVSVVVSGLAAVAALAALVVWRATGASDRCWRRPSRWPACCRSCSGAGSGRGCRAARRSGCWCSPPPP